MRMRVRRVNEYKEHIYIEGKKVTLINRKMENDALLRRSRMINIIGTISITTIFVLMFVVGGIFGREEFLSRIGVEDTWTPAKYAVVTLVVLTVVIINVVLLNRIGDEYDTL